MGKTKMTVGQAIVKFLNQQYIEMDGKVEPFVDGIFTIFGHGMVVGLGQALDEDPGHLRVYQGRNEQGMAHAAISYAKQHNRRKIIACSSSIGVGAANMVTAALTATINNLPLLLFPFELLQLFSKFILDRMKLLQPVADLDGAADRQHDICQVDHKQN